MGHTKKKKNPTIRILESMNCPSGHLFGLYTKPIRYNNHTKEMNMLDLFHEWEMRIQEQIFVRPNWIKMLDIIVRKHSNILKHEN